MRKEIKKLPKELQEAYKKVQDRPDENTPDSIMAFTNQDESAFLDTYTNPFLINEIVDFADPSLLDLDLDEKTGNDDVYRDFALEVTKKIVGLVNLDTKQSKPLEFYDNNPKIKRLKARDFTEIGNLSDLTTKEKALAYAKFYGVENDEDFNSLTEWEMRLFVDKVSSRQYTSVEKK